MDYVLELQEVARNLDNQKQKLLLEVAKGFLHDDYDVLTEEDLRDIEIAEKEFAEGRTGSWENIK